MKYSLEIKISERKYSNCEFLPLSTNSEIFPEAVFPVAGDKLCLDVTEH